MIDMDKVIESFDEAKELVWTDDDYFTMGYNNGLEAGKNIAIALLKKQEPKLSYRDAKKITHTATKLDDATCPSCGNVVGEKRIWEGRKIIIQWKYCIFCGQKLDWEGQ